MKGKLYKLITFLILCVSINICSAQDLAKTVRNDFCKNALFESKYGNDTFKAIMNYAVRNTGVNTLEEMITSIENICYNHKLQEEFFKLIYSMGRSRDMVFMQFHSMGMKPENATKLTDYILTKYNVTEKIESNNTESTKTSKSKSENFDLSKDSYENESAIIKNIINVENGVYIVVDVVQIKYSENPDDDFDYEVINENLKLRTYKVIPNVLIKDSQCMESTTSNYLSHNKERIKTVSPFGFVLITTNNKGELTKLNLGCWN